MQRGDLHHDVDELSLDIAAGDDSLGVPSASLVITWALVGVAADPTFPLVVKVLIGESSTGELVVVVVDGGTESESPET